MLRVLSRRYPSFPGSPWSIYYLGGRLFVGVPERKSSAIQPDDIHPSHYPHRLKQKKATCPLDSFDLVHGTPGQDTPIGEPSGHTSWLDWRCVSEAALGTKTALGRTWVIECMIESAPPAFPFFLLLRITFPLLHFVLFPSDLARLGYPASQ